MEVQSQHVYNRTPASRIKRLLAYGIDMIPISLVSFMLVHFVLHRIGDFNSDQATPGLKEDGSLGSLPLWIGRMTIYLFWTSYSFVMDQSPWQGTLGKKLMGIKVVDLQGQRIGWKQSLIRNLGKWMGLPLVVLLLWVFIDKNRQGLYDKIAHTLVV